MLLSSFSYYWSLMRKHCEWQQVFLFSIKTFIALLAQFATFEAVIFAVVTEVGGDDAIRITSGSIFIGSFGLLIITTDFMIFTTFRLTLYITLSVGSLRFIRIAMIMITVCGFIWLFFLIGVWRFGYVRDCLFNVLTTLYVPHLQKMSISPWIQLSYSRMQRELLIWGVPT